MHLKNYEETAPNSKERALAALVVSDRKNARAAAWSWAEEALEIAQDLGLDVDLSILGEGRYPETDDLRKLLEL